MKYARIDTSFVIHFQEVICLVSLYHKNLQEKECVIDKVWQMLLEDKFLFWNETKLWVFFNLSVNEGGGELKRGNIYQLKFQEQSCYFTKKLLFIPKNR